MPAILFLLPAYLRLSVEDVLIFINACLQKPLS
jgi:hypothetical protein